MRKCIIKIFVFIFVFTSSFQAQAAKRALLIAINEYKDPKVVKLDGCVNDGNNIMKVLKENLSFKDSEIRYIKNEEATRDRILREFDDWLIDGTAPGDKIFISYSGHGSYIADRNGDETDDASDETLCPYDTDRTGYSLNRNMIIDDEIGEKLKALEGRLVVMIFDSCHSGTSSRSLNTSTVRSLSYLDEPASEGLSSRNALNPGSQTRNSRLYSLSEEIDASKSYMVFLSATSPHQKAYEIKVKEEKYGALNYSFIEASKEKRGDVNLSDIKDKFYAVKKTQTDIYDQDPQIEGNPDLAKRSLREIFSDSYLLDLAYAAKNSNPNIALSIWANEKGKTGFRQFDSMQFHVQCNEEGYLYLFNLMESSSEMYLIYPNYWSLERNPEKSNYIAKNEEILFPPPPIKGLPISFNFKADKTGKEKIIAIVTRSPWIEMDAVIGQNNEAKKLMSDQDKMKILGLLYRRQSERHAEYQGTNLPDDWAGACLDIEVY
jgi:hypothetical protein